MPPSPAIDAEFYKTKHTSNKKKTNKIIVITKLTFRVIKCLKW